MIGSHLIVFVGIVCGFWFSAMNQGQIRIRVSERFVV